MKKQLLSKWLVLMSAGVALASCGTDTAQTPEEAETTDKVEEVETNTSEAAEEVSAAFAIEIDGETLSELSQEVTVPVGATVMDVMHESYDVVDEGGFLSAIAGHEQDVDAERYWMFYVNDEMTSVGAAEYEIEEGDHVEWRLEDSDF